MLDPTKILAGIPAGLRDPLIAEFKGLVSAYARGVWRTTALDAGRFCEVVYSILDGALSDAFPASPEKPQRFIEACRALESRPKVPVGDHSLRLFIPRVLPGIYEVRNNRNVGHVGGDVAANKMDAQFVKESASWILCELVRVFHSVGTAEAQAAVDALVERQHPLVWEIDGIRRVLNPDMPAGDRSLVLLHGADGWLDVDTLGGWVKYKVNFRRQVLERLAERMLVELDVEKNRVAITPLGIQRAETLVA